MASFHEKKGIIYAIGPARQGVVKIGSTRRPVQQRLKDLQTGSSARLSLIAHVEVAGDLRRIEMLVHELLRAQRLRGEWFAVSMNQVRLEALVFQAVASIAAQDRSQLSESVANRLAAILSMTNEECAIYLAEGNQQDWTPLTDTEFFAYVETVRSDESPSPPVLAEAEALLAADEQEWMTMDDEAFDVLLRAGDGPLAWDA